MDRIISQDGLSDVNYANVHLNVQLVVDPRKAWAIYAVDNGIYVELGQYSTKERVMEVMEELQEHAHIEGDLGRAYYYPMPDE